MAVQIYKSTDTGAPGLDGLPGSLVALLKACLVDGFGVLPAAGWTLELDDLLNHRMILRNDTVNGTGRYFVFRDDGDVRLDGTYSTTSIATFHGCESYTDIDTTSGNFPNLNGDPNPDQNMTTARGLTIHKSNVEDASLRPWTLIADERTFYLFAWIWNTTNDNPETIVPSSSADSIACGVMCGDFVTLNGTPDPYACAVIGGMGQYLSSANYSDHKFAGSSGDTIVGGHYINRSMEGGAGAVGFGKQPVLLRPYSQIGGRPFSAMEGNYLPYPMPQTGGMMISELGLWEEKSAPEKVNTSLDSKYLIRGTMRGIYGVPHTIDQARSDNCGSAFDTFTINGKSYLLLSANDASNGATIALDITGPW